MREIKFRGKSKHSNNWLYGDLLRNQEGSLAIVPPFKLNSRNECSDYEVSEETIGQFTGLRDKNGKEVYENDLVSVSGQIFQVVHLKGMFAVEIKGCGYIPLKNIIFEIIGNIFDNKLLLEDLMPGKEVGI